MGATPANLEPDNEHPEGTDLVETSAPAANLSSPEPARDDMVDTSASVAKSDKQEPSQTDLVRKPAPIIHLSPPEPAPANLEVYVVKRGDTLWAISGRFTGNPFNYPRVARDNEIHNPHLIFPEQTIWIEQ